MPQRRHLHPEPAVVVAIGPHRDRLPVFVERSDPQLRSMMRRQPRLAAHHPAHLLMAQPGPGHVLLGVRLRERIQHAAQKSRVVARPTDLSTRLMEHEHRTRRHYELVTCYRDQAARRRGYPVYFDSHSSRMPIDQACDGKCLAGVPAGRMEHDPNVAAVSALQKSRHGPKRERTPTAYHSAHIDAPIRHRPPPPAHRPLSSRPAPRSQTQDHIPRREANRPSVQSAPTGE